MAPDRTSEQSFLRGPQLPQSSVGAAVVQQHAGFSWVLGQQVLAAHPDRVASFRGGKTGLLGFFVGQVMQRTDGRVEPQVVWEILERQLGS